MTNTKFTDLEADTLTVAGTDITEQIAEIANLEGLSAAEVAFLDGAAAATPTAGKVVVATSGLAALLSAIPVTATLTPAAEGTNAIVVGVQLNGINGTALANRAVVGFFLSSDANGDVPTNPAVVDIVPTATGDGAMVNDALTTTHFGWEMVSEADGDIDITLTNAGDDAVVNYLHCVAHGVIIGSCTLTFADDTP